MQSVQKILVPAAHYPIKLISWKVKIGTTVQKDESLGFYEYNEKVEISVDGKSIFENRLERKEFRSFYHGKLESILVSEGQVCTGGPLATIIEPCSHAVQLHGLCALCGKDLSIPDYTGSEMHRATINMTHDSKGVTISKKEAERIEHERAQGLLGKRKLSLLLDLDQTVIHATVDPTVGEWMRDRENPNFPALHDVYSFVLPESPIVYYIKLRPETRNFLSKMQKMYELHIYTMGSRSYAHAVAQILDPDKTIFKDRILSRDDSGSFTVKSIQRLFPCDQSMVVVVDDRADVWHWSPNLLKVKPYDFFVGIGDINEPLKLLQQQNRHKAPGILPPPDVTPALDDNTIDTDTDTDTDSQSGEKKAEFLAAMQDAQQHSLHDQEVAKPLLHSQELLNAESRKQRPVLVDNDRDLIDLENILKKLHSNFYREFDLGSGNADVRYLLPSIKCKILENLHIAFSGVFPIQMDISKQDIWINAEIFGAQCQTELDERTTHLVAKKLGTAKVNTAIELGSIWIVTPDWLLDTLTKWKKMNEENYLLDSEIIPRIKNRSWDIEEAIKGKIGKDDWKEMDKEIEEAMGESDSEDLLANNSTDEEWPDLENEIDDLLSEPDSSEPNLGKRKQRDE